MTRRLAFGCQLSAIRLSLTESRKPIAESDREFDILTEFRS
jgi:hypothetical protein